MGLGARRSACQHACSWPGGGSRGRCEKQVCHVPVALVEEGQVVSLHRILQHQDQTGMVYHTEPECGSLAGMAGAHLVFISHIFLEDGESRGILQHMVESLSTTGFV